MEHFYKRIGYRGRLDDISLVVCRDFKLGEFISNELVTVGYEDFNFTLETTKGKYLVKVFAKFRKDKDCRRYVDVMRKAVESGVSTPKLFKSDQGCLYIKTVGGAKLRICVMQYIDGKSYFSAGGKPNKEEIRFLARQAALINSMNIKPDFVYDDWAITNFARGYSKCAKYLSKRDLQSIKHLFKRFRDMKIEGLPHCFVHGDIIVTNVMKSGNKLWIIDFAVSNYYPRIQELAVLACDLLFDENSHERSKKNLEIALSEYQKITPLTKRELEVLPTYIRVAHAMHVLLANYHKVAKKNSTKENEYFLNEGRMGLKQTA